MNKKVLSWVFMILGVAVLATGIVLRFAFNNGAVSLDAAALSLIGLSLSLEYKDKKYRVVLRVFQGLSSAVIIANAISWFVVFPSPAMLTIRLLSIAVNLPLAALGLKKNTGTSQ